ncbi:MAG: hypothetical protein QOE29_2244 [Gaiellaceae bacterium]|nr:hypothetical protein [Gaiellaceae bacterium]
MLGLLLVLLIIIALFGTGIAGAVNLLVWVAAILLVVWLLGFAFRSGEGTRWYRW